MKIADTAGSKTVHQKQNRDCPSLHIREEPTIKSI